LAILLLLPFFLFSGRNDYRYCIDPGTPLFPFSPFPPFSARVDGIDVMCLPVFKAEPLLGTFSFFFFSLSFFFVFPPTEKVALLRFYKKRHHARLRQRAVSVFLPLSPVLFLSWGSFVRNGGNADRCRWREVVQGPPLPPLFLQTQ